MLVGLPRRLFTRLAYVYMFGVSVSTFKFTDSHSQCNDISLPGYVICVSNYLCVCVCVCVCISLQSVCECVYAGGCVYVCVREGGCVCVCVCVCCNGFWPQ